MKRSDMVKIGITRLKKIANNPLCNISLQEDDYKFLASSLLNCYEETGMLPPSVGIGKEDRWGYLHYENEWEDEDE